MSLARTGKDDSDNEVCDDSGLLVGTNVAINESVKLGGKQATLSDQGGQIEDNAGMSSPQSHARCQFPRSA